LTPADYYQSGDITWVAGRSGALLQKAKPDRGGGPAAASLTFLRTSTNFNGNAKGGFARIPGFGCSRVDADMLVPVEPSLRQKMG